MFTYDTNQSKHLYQVNYLPKHAMSVLLDCQPKENEIQYKNVDIYESKESTKNLGILSCASVRGNNNRGIICL